MLGLVLVQHGKRTEVLPAEEWDILSDVVQEALRREGRVGPLLRDLYEFRLLVEPDAARLMAERGSDREVSELARLAQTMSELAEKTGRDQGAEHRPCVPCRGLGLPPPRRPRERQQPARRGHPRHP